jgi:predicted phage terminase large subunit-like protein
MEKTISNLDVIDTTYKGLYKIIKNTKTWGEDKSIIELYGIMADCINAEIHGNLTAYKSKENEAQIRNLIRRYVIGGKEKNTVWIGALSCIESKLTTLLRQRNRNNDLIHKYMSLYDDFMALASFRSFKHFCLYMETDWDKKVWKPTTQIFDGWYYYANQMVLDGKIKFIEKQLPTGYGKSFSDCMLISWIFGIDINNDVLKVFGNKFNCERAFDSICDLMCSKRFAKVFPYYQKFEGKRENVFATCKQKDGTFKIEGSSKPVNFLTVGKESKISGVRAKFLFLDDITQAEDAASIRMHDKDISTYKEVWFKRRYSSDNFYIIASGTTYSIYDILSWLKSKFGGEKAIKSKVNKYTKIGVSNQICMNGASVFICVPKLDYETDESTYPEEYPTEQARQQRQDDYENFMAMEQQTPCTPKNSPFYMSNLQEYEELPEINKNGRTASCWAYLDGKRKGSDFCSMPIFTPINNKHYLIDAFYDNRAMKECYNGIIAKIVQHHITKLYIENNINEGLKTLLDKMLFERGITFCKIEEVYNTGKKDVRIANAEAEIKANVVFPKFGLYARSSPIGQAMDELYGYSYVKKNEHDDFTDSIAGYVECFVSQNIKQMATISIFGR